MSPVQTRTYTLKRRAEQQAATRQRIVEAALALHGELGPARTSLSQVAERAEVQRNTLYAHFPDERSLLMACSALSLERDPLPDAAAWRSIADSGERLRTGICALYAWYARNADLAGCVLRDTELSPLVAEIAALRYGPAMAAMQETLGKGLKAPQRALLKLALDYSSWRSLLRDSGMSQRQAVEVLVRAIAPHSAGK